MKKTKVILAAFAACVVWASGCNDDTIIYQDKNCSDCGENYCCGGRCVDIQTDAEACGGCGIICSPGQSCKDGKCETPADACGGCREGLTCCGTTCVALSGNDKNCGKCGLVCPDGMTCSEGRCADTHTIACDESCTSPRTCCGEGEAQKCANIDYDNSNCGSCGNVCGADEICENGKCVSTTVSTCEAGCGMGACCDGKCVDTLTDAKYCGSCDNACGQDLFCQGGKCVSACVCPDNQVCNEQGICVTSCGGVACGEDEICCGDKCVSSLAPTSCGSCTNVCGTDKPTCQNGECVLTCDGSKEACNGVCVDLKANDDHCGACNTRCGNGKKCIEGECACKPKTCAELGYTCGKIDDGCGNELDCGSCVEGQACNNNVCGCKPKTCASAGKNCGQLSDGCGGTLNCGSCSSNQTCKDNVCGCVPATCSSLGKNCGSVSDGCGGTLKCGSCSGNQECSSDNVCKPKACTPATCSSLGKNCGSVSDGCGGTLKCGTCSSGYTCSGNVCSCTKKTCSSLGYTCGTASDGCGGTLNCGSCSSGYACTNNKCVSTADPYPTRKSIKGIQPDFPTFRDANQIIGNDAAGIAVNMLWIQWEPNQSAENCGGVMYDGHCFYPNTDIVNHIKQYTDAGVVVTAVVYGVPPWARRPCSGVVDPYFCAPTEEGSQGYGRFVGFLANYFNGKQGHGRIADFVIHNEVNATEWFNYGCTRNTCDVGTWTTVYSQSWNAAYDYAKKEQPNSKILISFEHHFGSTFDSMLSNNRPVVSAETFLKYLIPKLGNRDWRIAWHSYPPDLSNPAFGANDWPRITFGNIGVLAGWLRKNYPSDPHAWEIQLTENGINGTTAAMQTTQATQLCQAFRNILGTPGIESFIYHRLLDHSTELAAGLGLGLWNENGTQKPAWSVWALANRVGVAQGYPSCGFEDLPYIRIRRGYNGSTGRHWVTTRQFPNGFKQESSWRILREPASNTTLIYECRVGGANGAHTMPSTDANCEGQFNMGPMGYVYNTKVSGSVPLYRCLISASGSHFVSEASNCEGQKTESLIGYVLP